MKRLTKNQKRARAKARQRFQEWRKVEDARRTRLRAAEPVLVELDAAKARYDAACDAGRKLVSANVFSFLAAMTNRYPCPGHDADEDRLCLLCRADHAVEEIQNAIEQLCARDRLAIEEAEARVDARIRDEHHAEEIAWRRSLGMAEQTGEIDG